MLHVTDPVKIQIIDQIIPAMSDGQNSPNTSRINVSDFHYMSPKAEWHAFEAGRPAIER